MEAVQREHDRIVKKTKGSQGIKNVQSTIDLLQSARDAIAAGMSSVPIPALLPLTASDRPYIGFCHLSQASNTREILL